MRITSIKYLFLLMMSAFLLASCSETEDESGAEFDNWQAKNEQAFLDTLAYARQHEGSGEWKVIRNWSLQNQTPNEDGNGNPLTPVYDDTDNLVVRVIEAGTGSGLPMFTDSVRVSYCGRILPSSSYPEGYVFDTTFNTPYDKKTALTANMLISQRTDGFATAMLNMHIGDHWMLYVPHQLGYGAQDQTSSGIPAYSMLRFEVVLDAYYRPTVGWITK